MSDGAAAGRVRAHRALDRRRSPSPFARARADARGRAWVSIPARARTDLTFRTAAQLLLEATCWPAAAGHRSTRPVRVGCARTRIACAARAIRGRAQAARHAAPSARSLHRRHRPPPVSSNRSHVVCRNGGPRRLPQRWAPGRAAGGALPPGKERLQAPYVYSLFSVVPSKRDVAMTLGGVVQLLVLKHREILADPPARRARLDDRVDEAALCRLDWV